MRLDADEALRAGAALLGGVRRLLRCRHFDLLKARPTTWSRPIKGR